MKWDEDIDASGDALLSADEAVAFEAENHLMDRGRTDAEVALHVGLGRRTPEHARVSVDEGQILALFFGKALPTGATRSA